MRVNCSVIFVLDCTKEFFVSRRLMIAGNWKMNLNRATAASLLSSLGSELKTLGGAVDVLVCPPYPYLTAAVDAVAGSGIGVGGQDASFREPGAFTGEVAAEMVKDSGCEWVILGHSERRQYHSESDDVVNKKVMKALSVGLNVILCVGEQLAQRESGQTDTVLATQMSGSLAGVSAEQMASTVIAYEPVWAIGTGKVASEEQAQAAHAFLRGWLSERFGASVAAATRILYGGSVKGENAAGLLGQPDVDGALVGNASLKPETFLPIIRAGVAVAS